jgi:hypothetical protein
MTPTKPDVLSLHQFLTILVTNELSSSFNIDYTGININLMVDDYTKRLDKEFFLETFNLHLDDLSNDEAYIYYMKYINCFVTIDSRVDEELPKHRKIDLAVVTDVNEPEEIKMKLKELRKL